VRQTGGESLKLWCRLGQPRPAKFGDNCRRRKKGLGGDEDKAFVILVQGRDLDAQKEWERDDIRTLRKETQKHRAREQNQEGANFVPWEQNDKERHESKTYE